MIDKGLYAIAVLMLAASLLACSSQAGGDRSGSQAADSIEATAPLPDTAFSSVGELDFVTEIFDSVHSGVIRDLHDPFLATPGSFTFRGNMARNAGSGGRVDGRPTRIVRDWVFETDEDYTPTKLGVWGGGMGWTGQPLYVHWPDSIAERFRRESPALTPDFGPDEIIAGSLFGVVYFINFDTGKASRRPLPVGNPVKGTPCLDPTLNGNLYVGQGIPREQPVGQTAHNLFTHTTIFGARHDAAAWRGWGTSDSSPLVMDGFLLWPSENGTFYKYRIAADGSVKLHSALRYKVKGFNAPGVESSLCVYRNYGYFGDNHGNILCVNLNTMRPVWRYSVADDIDATIVLDVENGTPVLYAACEVDRQGQTGACHIVKLNALDGSPVWKHDIACNRMDIDKKHYDGGVYGTPLLGRGNCRGRIFFNVCQIGDGTKAHFVALDTRTGSEVYRLPLKFFAWNSPVAFYNDSNELFVFTGDSAGYAYLIDAAKGEILFSQPMANNFESSAVVVGNSLVVGSRGKQIYRFSIQ